MRDDDTDEADDDEADDVPEWEWGIDGKMREKLEELGEHTDRVRLEAVVDVRDLDVPEATAEALARDMEATWREMVTED